MKFNAAVEFLVQFYFLGKFVGANDVDGRCPLLIGNKNEKNAFGMLDVFQFQF